MDLKWQFTNDKPIYHQITEQIKEMIVSGALAPGDRVPTVREISESASVNPNTVQKAFAELEETGLVHTYSTAGRFVTKSKPVIAATRREIIDDVVAEFMREMKLYGYTKEEIAQIITEYEEI